MNAWLYRLWGHVPGWLRRRVVRLLSPSFTVGAICLVRRDDQVLLVRHSYRDAWGVPGGLLKRHEEPTDAAVRETREEIGLDIELTGEAAVVTLVELQQIDHVFVARCSDVHAVPTPCSPEILDVRWFPIGALPPVQRETRAALEALGIL